MLHRLSRRIGVTMLSLSLLGSGYVLVAQKSGLKEFARKSLAQIDGEIPLSGLQKPVEVIRDQWGVPHIYAQSVDDLFF